MPTAPPGERPGRQGIRSRRRTGRIAAIVVAAVVVAGAGLYLPLTLLAPVPTTAASPIAHPIPARAAAAPELPATGSSAIAATGYPNASASGGTADPLPIASISKLVTALVALDAKPLQPGQPGPTITFGAPDAALFAKYTAMDGKAEPMAVGSSLSELDLLRVVLVVSANNYADALATWSYGSEARFLDATTAWLAAHRLTHTTIVEPTGINPKNTSTPGDLITLGGLVLANPVLAQIVSTPSVSLPGIGTFDNTNGLLGHDGVDGIKSGTLDDHGTDLLFAANYRIGGTTVRVIGAVLGASDHSTLYAAVRAMLSSVKKGFHVVRLATAGESFAAYSPPWQHRVEAIATRSASAVVWSDSPVTATVAAPRTGLAGTGAKAGSVTFTTDTETIVVPLTLNRAVADPGPWWRLAHPALLR